MDAVMFRFSGREFAIPRGHALSRIMAGHPQYGTNLGRVARAVQAAVVDLSIIDVGGNVGDSVAVIREVCDAPILTVEGHEPYLDYLRRNVAGIPGVELHESFVAGIETGWLSDVSATSGTARLVTGEAAGAVRQMALADVLAAHPAFADAKLFKLDTDGMDVSIVLASLGYIRRVHPVIFLEYDPALAAPPQVPAKALWKPLREAGYRYALVWENTGFYIGCLDASDPLTADETNAAASGWSTQRYFDLCLIHADDAAIADRVRKSEVEYARTAPKYGPDAAGSERDLRDRYGVRALGRAFLGAAVRWPAKAFRL